MIRDTFPIRGIVVNENEFTGAVDTSTLCNILVKRDPRLSEIKQERESYALLQDLFEMRDEVQRTFSGAKDHNVTSYAEYLIATEVEHQDGAVPPIVLWTTEKLEINEDGTVLNYPCDCLLVAVDGESQTAARFEAFKANRAIGQSRCKVVVYHGKQKDFAKQTFHDLNALGIRPSPNWASTLDQRNPATSIVRYLETSLPFLKGKVNYKAASLKGTQDLLSFLNLRMFVSTVANGIQAVAVKSPTPILTAKVKDVQATARLFLEKLYARFPTELTDPANYVMLNSTVFGPLGALVTDCVEMEDPNREQREAGLTIESPSARETAVNNVITSLDGVSWRSAGNWLSVAGRLSKPAKDGSTKVVFGGAKQSGHAVYGALRNKDSESWMVVRGLKPPPKPGIEVNNLELESVIKDPPLD